MSVFGIPEAGDKLVSANYANRVAVVAAIDRNTAALDQINKTLGRFFGPPSATKGFSITLIREEKGQENMPTFNLYSSAIPEATGPNAGDVVAGRIVISLDGLPQPSVETPKGPATFEGLKLEQGKTALVGFVHVDDAGNQSLNPLYLPEFLVSDTVPPPDAVEGFGLTPIGEVTE